MWDGPGICSDKDIAGRSWSRDSVTGGKQASLSGNRCMCLWLHVECLIQPEWIVTIRQSIIAKRFEIWGTAFGLYVLNPMTDRERGRF